MVVVINKSSATISETKMVERKKNIRMTILQNRENATVSLFFQAVVLMLLFFFYVYFLFSKYVGIIMTS
jgi:hypothetical protein